MIWTGASQPKFGKQPVHDVRVHGTNDISGLATNRCSSKRLAWVSELSSAAPSGDQAANTHNAKHQPQAVLLSCPYPGKQCKAPHDNTQGLSTAEPGPESRFWPLKKNPCARFLLRLSASLVVQLPAMSEGVRPVSTIGGKALSSTFWRHDRPGPGLISCHLWQD